MSVLTPMTARVTAVAVVLSVAHTARPAVLARALNRVTVVTAMTGNGNDNRLIGGTDILTSTTALLATEHSG